MRYEIGVDIGGTFTDFVALDYKTNALTSDKILTTPDQPALAVIDGLTNLDSKYGIKLDQVARLLHATTLATNALIERKGARTGLLTTAGFEDVLDIRKGMRYNQYDLKIQVPKAYVPRYLRRGVGERVTASGEILREISESEILEQVNELLAEGMESMAICFLHSYSNPINEIGARQVIKKNFPSLAVSISSEVTTQAREYERMSTTVADAYVKPIIEHYLDDLEKKLARLGFSGKLLIMTCSGGMVVPAIARKIPVLLLESGPVAGVSISSRIGKRLGLRGVFSFDMGGTTAKGSILTEGRIEKSYEFEAARVDKFRRGSGVPISIPTVRLIEIGSGGGGIARVDNLGIVRVGPESAGAKPGPACYNLGGTEPTVTDSNLVLGYLDGDYFLGGEMRLSSELARSAIQSQIATRTGLSIEKAAWAIHERANEDVASAFRLHASEVGVDYRNYSFISFGGAGPVHAARIARKLLATHVAIPPRAGVLSAEGLLTSPLSIDMSQSKRIELSDIKFENYVGVFSEIISKASTTLLASGVAKHEIRVLRRLDMCYHGQGFDIAVDLKGELPTRDELSDLAKMFEGAYKSKYSISALSNAIEITSFKATVFAAKKRENHSLWERKASKKDDSEDRGRPKRRSAFDPESMKFRNFEVIKRYSLRKNESVRGPALVQERESTSVIPSGCIGTVEKSGNLIIAVRI